MFGGELMAVVLAGFSVLESLCATPKGDDEKNEDRLVITDDFVAVIDGATSSVTINGVSGGVLAAQAVADVLADLPKDSTARRFLDAASQKVAERIGAWPDRTKARPSASVVVWSRAREEIWRVGDCHFRLDQAEYSGEKNIDRIAYAFRRAVLRGRVAFGLSDDARELLVPTLKQPFMPLVEVQHAFANVDCPDPLAYGIVDGRFVPDRFLEVFPADFATDIILCSDGFPEAFPTLAEGLQALAALKRDDPLMVLASCGSRPFPPAQPYYDDTTYVRIKRDLSDAS